MEASHSLLLNEEAWRLCADPVKPVFFYEWLRYLDRVLPHTHKSDLRSSQQQLLAQLLARMASGVGPPTRRLLASAISRVFAISGDTAGVLGVANACNDTLRQKDTSSSVEHTLAVKFCALSVLSALWQRVPTQTGRSFEETFQVTSKWLKTAESAARVEIWSAWASLVEGVGGQALGVPMQRAIFKLARAHITDRVPAVRAAVARCLAALVRNPAGASGQTTGEALPDVDGVVALALAGCSVVGGSSSTSSSSSSSSGAGTALSLDGAGFPDSDAPIDETRRAFARLLAAALATATRSTNRNNTSQAVASSSASSEEVRQQQTQQSSKNAPAASTSNGNAAPGRRLSPDEALCTLAAPFLRGGTAGFLKAYVELCHELGAAWLERHVPVFVRHLLDVASRAGALAYSNNLVQADESRWLCSALAAILRSTLGEQLAESAQLAAFRALGAALATHASNWSADFGESSSASSADGAELVGLGGADVHASAAVIQLALLEMSALLDQVGWNAAAASADDEFVEFVLQRIGAAHPLPSARLSAAWLLRRIGRAAPTQLAALVERPLRAIAEDSRAPLAALAGNSAALAALLAEAATSPLGLAHHKPQQVLSLAEQLLRSSSEVPRLAGARSAAGWLLITALSRFPHTVKTARGRLAVLWRSAFPRSANEADAEVKQRGDRASWWCVLTARAGALGAMDAFAQTCPDVLAAERDVLESMVLPIEATLATLAKTGTLLKEYGAQLRPAVALLRVRCYALCARLPPKLLESGTAGTGPVSGTSCVSVLLRELVADLTLSDSPATATFCTQAERFVWPAAVQCLLRAGAAYPPPEKDAPLRTVLSTTNAPPQLGPDALAILRSDSDVGWWPSSPPPAAAAVDAAVDTFARLFARISTRHRLQVVQHFGECVKSAAAQPARQHAIYVNVLCALNGALQSPRGRGASTSSGSGKSESSDALRQAIVSLAAGALSSTGSTVLRCLAAETLGRLAQAATDPPFVAALAQWCFDKVKTPTPRDGLALTLGALHRHVGSLGSGQHLHTAVSILLAVAQQHDTQLLRSSASSGALTASGEKDKSAASSSSSSVAPPSTSPSATTAAVLALAGIAESGAASVRGYVEPLLSLCIRLLLVGTASTSKRLAVAVGRLVQSLISVVGPDLGVDAGLESLRASFNVASALLLGATNWPEARAEGVVGLQQLHLFASRHVQLEQLVQQLAPLLLSDQHVLRSAVACCLRQLMAREARAVRTHSETLVPVGMVERRRAAALASEPLHSLPDSALEGALLLALDRHHDSATKNHLQECLLSLVTATGADRLGHWLQLAKELLAAAASEPGSQRRPNQDEEDELEEDDEDESLGGRAGRAQSRGAKQKPGAAGSDEAGGLPGGCRPLLAARWQTRVFAVQLVERLMASCAERAHTDLALAKQLQQANPAVDFLVLHLADLVRMSFMAATAHNTNLRLAGLRCLQDVIARFASVREPEFPGHVVLEQFQAQVSAALRPAFEADSPAPVMAAACDVCSTWIGSRVARHHEDLRRVHNLLVTALSRLPIGRQRTSSDVAPPPPPPLQHNESQETLEQLAILKAWAEVFVVAHQQHEELGTTAAAATTRTGDDYEDGTGNGATATFTGAGGGNEEASLLELVEPELSSLVGCWIAALRDAARLLVMGAGRRKHQLAVTSNHHHHHHQQQQLESDDQMLSYTNGPKDGTFFRAATASAVRTHYQASWPALLLAAATWLRRADFELPERTAAALDPTTAQQQQDSGMWSSGTEESVLASNTEPARQARVRLIVGLAVDALASNRIEHDGTVQKCVLAIRQILGCPWSRAELVADEGGVVAKELLAVLHRQVLLRDSLETQQMCAQCAHDVLRALIERRRRTEEDMEEVELTAEEEGGDVWRSALEFALSLLVRHMPQLRDWSGARWRSAEMQQQQQHSTPQQHHHVRRLSRLGADVQRLVQLGVVMLVQVGELIPREQQKIDVLPVQLQLLMAVFREAALSEPASTQQQQASVVAPVAAATIQALRQLVTSSSVSSPTADQDSKRLNRWLEVWRSALHMLTSMPDESVDASTALVAATAIAGASPVPQLLIGHSALFARYARLVGINLESHIHLVRLRAVSALVALATRGVPLAPAVGRQMGAQIAALLKPLLQAGTNEEDAALIEECVKFFEALLSAIVVPKNELSLLCVLVQVLGSRLLPPSSSSSSDGGDDDSITAAATPSARRLHRFALTRLHQLGPAHRDAFTTVLAALPDLKLRLAAAVQAEATRAAALASAADSRRAAAEARRAAQAAAASAQPAIKLKTFGQL